MNALIIAAALVCRCSRRFVLEESVGPVLGAVFVLAAAIAGPNPHQERNLWSPVSGRHRIESCELSHVKTARPRDTDVDKWLQTFTNKHGVAEVLLTPPAQSHLRRGLGYGGTAVYSFWRKLRAVIAVRPPPTSGERKPCCMSSGDP